MNRYKKIEDGSEVLGWQVTGASAKLIAGWCDGVQVEEIDPFDHQEYVGINVPTPDGMRRASEGDYVIQHDGWFYVAKPTGFENRFEPVY